MAPFRCAVTDCPSPVTCRSMAIPTPDHAPTHPTPSAHPAHPARPAAQVCPTLSPASRRFAASGDIVGHARGVVALAVAAVLGAAACTGSSGSAQANTTVAPTTTVAASAVPARASQGCTATTKVAAGETKVDTTSGGVARWYRRHVPPKYDGTAPLPLVVDLHGYQEGADVHAGMSQMGAFGDTHGFVTITPNGTANPVPRWDVALDSADMRFIGDLLDEAERTLCIDTRRVFVSGLSNGAFMTSAVACAYGDRIAAVAPVAGVTADITGCTPARAVPVVSFHGTADGFVAYDGGMGKAAANLPSPDGKGKIGDNPEFMTRLKRKSVPEQMDMWAKRNACMTPAKQETIASDVTRLFYACPAGADVELYRITDGGHAWPGSAFSKQIENVVGRTTFSIDANAVMWEFFTAHPLRT